MKLKMGNAKSRQENASELQKLSEQVKSFPNLITKGDVKSRLEMVEDAMVIKYKELQDTGTLKRNIQSLFPNSEQPVQKFLVEVVKGMCSSLSETEEMTKIERNVQRQKVVPVDDKVMGMEAHYVVRGIESSGESRDRVELMIAYRLIVNIMKDNPRPTDYPDQVKWDVFGFDLGSLEYHKGLEFNTLLYYS